jgi:signal transduction histidine kinase
LQQVILNLIRNAIEAMSTVNDRARILRVRSEANDSGEVFITIEDSGSGIDPKDLDRIFEPFFTTKSKGMGMGRQFAAHRRSPWRALVGGTAASDGSVFHVVLPSSE